MGDRSRRLARCLICGIGVAAAQLGAITAVHCGWLGYALMFIGAVVGVATIECSVIRFGPILSTEVSDDDQ